MNVESMISIMSKAAEESISNYHLHDHDHDQHHDHPVFEGGRGEI